MRRSTSNRSKERRFNTLRRRLSLASILSSVIFTPSVLAGEYVLEKGRGVEVCEAYAKNLNSHFSYTPVGSLKPIISNPAGMPYRCERPINPEFKEFSKPVWKSMVRWMPETNALLEKIDKFLWERDANPVYYFSDWKNWKGTKEQYEKAWQGYKNDRDARQMLGHYVGVVDIDNDGETDEIYFDRTCGSVYGSLLLVLNKDQSDIERKKTELVMPHPSRKEQKLGEFRKLAGDERRPTHPHLGHGYTMVEDSMHEAYYGVFRYKEKTYFDLWWNQHPAYLGKLDIQVGKLRVFLIENKRTREVCTYKYHDTD